MIKCYKQLINNFYGDKCYNCDKIDILHLHHIDEDKDNNKLNNIILLCKECHNNIHTKKKERKKIMENVVKYPRLYSMCRICGNLIMGKNIDDFSYNWRCHIILHKENILPEYYKIETNVLEESNDNLNTIECGKMVIIDNTKYMVNKNNGIVTLHKVKSLPKSKNIKADIKEVLNNGKRNKN
jgi:uncharacterized protein YlaI